MLNGETLGLLKHDHVHPLLSFSYTEYIFTHVNLSLFPYFLMIQMKSSKAIIISVIEILVYFRIK